MFTPKEISDITYPDLKKKTIKNIQKKDKKLESIFAKMSLKLNVDTLMVKLIGLMLIFYEWPIVFKTI